MPVCLQMLIQELENSMQGAPDTGDTLPLVCITLHATALLPVSRLVGQVPRDGLVCLLELTPIASLTLQVLVDGLLQRHSKLWPKASAVLRGYSHHGSHAFSRS